MRLGLRSGFGAASASGATGFGSDCASAAGFASGFASAFDLGADVGAVSVAGFGSDPELASVPCFDSAAARGLRRRGLGLASDGA